MASPSTDEHTPHDGARREVCVGAPLCLTRVPDAMHSLC